MASETLLPNQGMNEVNFEWFSCWLKLSGCWNDGDLNLTKDKNVRDGCNWSISSIRHRLLLMLHFTVITIVVTMYILVLLSHFLDLKQFNLLINILSVEFDTDELIIIKIIECILIQSIRLISLYYFHFIQTTNTKNKLSFYFHNTLLVSKNDKNKNKNKNDVMTNNNIKIAFRNYSKYSQNMKLFVYFYFGLYLIRKTIFLILIINNDSDDISTIHNYNYNKNTGSILSVIFWVILEVSLFFIAVVVPFVTILVYMTILLIKIESNLLYLIHKLIIINSNKQASLQAIINLPNTQPMLMTSKYNEIDLLYTQLYHQWMAFWESKNNNINVNINNNNDDDDYNISSDNATKIAIWQWIFLLAGLSVLSVSWLALTFYNTNQNETSNVIEFWFRLSFAIMLLLPPTMVLYFAIRLNTTYQLLKKMIDYNIIYNNDNVKNGNGVTLTEWQDNVRIKTKLELYVIQCNLFGYPITLENVISAIVVFVISKIISILIQYQL